MITSRSNETIKKAASLKEKKNRDKYNMFLVEGDRFVNEAIKRNLRVVHLFFLKEKKEKYSFVENSVEVTKDVMDKLCDTKSPQGIVGVFEKPKIQNSAIKRNEKILYLDAVQMGENVGALIRSADAAGFDKVFLSKKCADVFSPKVIRSSAGSVFNIPFFYLDNLEIFNELKEKNYSIIAGDLNGEEKFSFPNKNVILIIGNEGNGISKEIREFCTDFIKIPIYGKAESLNASVSGGILMYKIAGY